VEREHMDKRNTMEWRKGAEVKFELHEKKPARREYRF
jgi:hypothetical protein